MPAAGTDDKRFKDRTEGEIGELKEQVRQLNQRVTTSNQVQLYIQSVNKTIETAADAWRTYGDVAEVAYSQAYGDMQTALHDIKEKYEAAARINELIANLALTVLTVGVAGPIATTLLKAKVAARVAAPLKSAAKAIGDKKTAEAVTKIAEETEKIAEDGFTDLTKKGFEGAAELLKAPSAKEAFSSPSVPPERYGSQVKANINARLFVLDSNVLSELKNLLTGLTSGAAGDISMDQARKAFEPLLATSFIKEPPPAVDPQKQQVSGGFQSQLTLQATLAMWLSWAWGRDLAYWADAEHYDVNYNLSHPNFGILANYPNQEPLYFDGLLPKLVRAGVPVAPITQFYYGKDMTGAYRDTKPHLNMHAFISWAFSPAALQLLINKLPPHPLGKQYAEMETRQKFIEAFLRKMGYMADDSGD